VLYDRYNTLWELLLQEMLTETFERKFVLKRLMMIGVATCVWVFCLFSTG